MRYAVQYRTKAKGWINAQAFDDVDEANRLRADAIRFEMKGTKDWRVTPIRTP